MLLMKRTAGFSIIGIGYYMDICRTFEQTAIAIAYYWISAGKTLEDAYALNQMVLDKTPSGMIHSTEQFWNAWLNKRSFHDYLLTPAQKKII